MIVAGDLCKQTPSNLNKLAILYDVTLRDILEEHAPVVTKQVVIRPHVPWFTDSVRAAKRKKRKAEKQWLKTKSGKDWDDFKSIRNSTLHLLNAARKDHHKYLVMENKDDQSNLFTFVKSLLNIISNTAIYCYLLCTQVVLLQTYKIDSLKNHLTVMQTTHRFSCHLGLMFLLKSNASRL